MTDPSPIVLNSRPVANLLGEKIEGLTSFKLGDGELLYAEAWLPDAEQWFDRLQTEVPWSPETVKMYGKALVLKRETCNFGENYDYNVNAKPAIEWAGPVLELKKVLEDATGHVFTQCACNLYPDGETGIGLHHDKRHPLLVASISFGAVRTIGFARKGGKLDKSLPMVPLASGSLLLFSDTVNEHFKHTIIEDKKVRGPRISVTFREFAPKRHFQQSHAASPESSKLANHGSPVSKNKTAPVPAIEKIESVKYQAPDFKDAKELRAAFDEGDKEVKTKASTAIDSQADVIIALAKVQAILSQRGKEKMRREAGIRLTWTKYYESFQKEFNFDQTLRAVQYKIGELAGKTRNRKCSECHKTNGHAKSCSKYKEPPLPHLTQLEAKLLDATSRAHGVVKAVKQGGNVDEAIAEFEMNAPTPEKLIEYAERPVTPSLATLAARPSKHSGNGLDYRGMLVDLLDQVEKLGTRLPIELHMKCKQFRTSIGLPPNVVSDPNWNSKEEEEDLPRESEEWNSVGRWEGTTGESTDLSEPDGVEY